MPFAAHPMSFTVEKLILLIANPIRWRVMSSLLFRCALFSMNSTRTVIMIFQLKNG